MWNLVMILWVSIPLILLLYLKRRRRHLRFTYLRRRARSLHRCIKPTLHVHCSSNDKHSLRQSSNFLVERIILLHVRVLTPLCLLWHQWFQILQVRRMHLCSSQTNLLLAIEHGAGKKPIAMIPSSTLILMQMDFSLILIEMVFSFSEPHSEWAFANDSGVSKAHNPI